MQRQSLKRGHLLFLAILLLVIGGAWLKRNAIYDAIRLYNYQPSAQVAQLATDDTLTPRARHLFYVNRPAVQDQAAFNSSCPNNGGEQTIVLGCYQNHETGIFMYQVTDPELNGVVQVTAAHETLHAIYERLSPKERSYVDGLLEDFYQHNLQDKRIEDTIAAYKQSEPNDVVNEMHSVFGTEVANLPPALESYYSQYFTNRAKVVSYATQYQAAFSSRKAQADNLLGQIQAFEAQLTPLKAQIDAAETDLSAKRQSLDNQRATSTDVASFNAQVAAYNAEVNQYQAQIAHYNSLVVQHNQLLSQYRVIALEESQLIKELDSRSSNVSSP